MRYEDEKLAHTLTVGGTVEDIGMLNDDDAWIIQRAVISFKAFPSC